MLCIDFPVYTHTAFSRSYNFISKFHNSMPNVCEKSYAKIYPTIRKLVSS